MLSRLILTFGSLTIKPCSCHGRSAVEGLNTSNSNCYICLVSGSLDSRCKSTSTTTASTPIEPIENEVKLSVSTTRRPNVSTKPPQCYIGSLDPRCRQQQSTTTTTTKQTSAILVDLRQDIYEEESLTKTSDSYSLEQELNKTPTSTTLKPIPSISTSAPKCYLGSLDPRCRQSFTTTTQRTPSTILISKISTTTAKPKPAPTCYPG